MTWVSKIKDIAITSPVGHVNRDPNLISGVPANTSFSFSPLELYGAAARCSHLHFVNSQISTVESEIIEKLVEQHVDNASSDFAILASANKFKDYVKSYFTGTVATGLAYLAMIREGYVWSDHFENVGGGNTTHQKSPDFVFSGPTVGVALMESKGSRSGTLNSFDNTVGNGYVDQVEPHLGYTVGGALASHGYCIGAWLQSTTKAELLFHHTTVPASSGSSGTASAPTLTTIQRHSFATAFSLAHSPGLGAELRRGESSRAEVMFSRIEWLGCRWLTRLGLRVPDRLRDREWRRRYPLARERNRLSLMSSTHIFAIEETIATAALRSFLRLGVLPTAEAEKIDPLDSTIGDKARDYRGEGDARGAMFPDGFAILDQSAPNGKSEAVKWSVRDARLTTLR